MRTREKARDLDAPIIKNGAIDVIWTDDAIEIVGGKQQIKIVDRDRLGRRIEQELKVDHVMGPATILHRKYQHFGNELVAAGRETEHHDFAAVIDASRYFVPESVV